MTFHLKANCNDVASKILLTANGGRFAVVFDITGTGDSGVVLVHDGRPITFISIPHPLHLSRLKTSVFYCKWQDTTP